MHLSFNYFNYLDYFNYLKSIDLVRGDIAGGLLDVDAVAVGDLLLAPVGDILGRGIAAYHIIDDLVVESVDDLALDLGEVHHHTVMVQLLGLAIDSDLPVVTMQLGALARVIQFQSVSARDFYMFLYVVHTAYFS
jgi:hypothetical protein